MAKLGNFLRSDDTTGPSASCLKATSAIVNIHNHNHAWHAVRSVEHFIMLRRPSFELACGSRTPNIAHLHPTSVTILGASFVSPKNTYDVLIHQVISKSSVIKMKILRLHDIYDIPPELT